MSLLIGVDVGGTKVLAGEVASDGSIVRTSTQRTPDRRVSVRAVEDALTAAVLDVADGRAVRLGSPIQARDLGIETVFQAIQRFEDERFLVIEMQPHVVARRFDPIDFIGPQEKQTAAGFDDEPLLARRRRGLELLDEAEQL